MRMDCLVPTGFALVVIPLAAGAAPPPPKANQPSQPLVQAPQGALTTVKPDLTVEKIWVTGTQPNPGGGTQVSISFTVYNASALDTQNYPTAAGTKFWHDNPWSNWLTLSWVDWREYPGGAFPPLQGDGSKATIYGPFGRATWNAAVVVPAGKRVEIRATADSLNFINESNEANNSKTVLWPPEPVKQLKRK